MAAAVLYPEYYITGDCPVFGTTVFQPLNLLLPVVAVSAAFVMVGRKIVKPALLDGIVIMFMTFIVLRNIAGSGAFLSIKYLVFGLGIFYLAVFITTRSGSSLPGTVWVLAALTAATALYGLAEYGLQSNIIFQQYIQESVREPVRGLHRIGSTLAHPVAYAAFLVQAAPFCVLAWARAGSRTGQTAAAFATVVAGLALFFTYSKGSWMVAAILAGTTALLLIRHNRRLVVIIAGATLTTALLLTAVFWQEINLETETRAEESVAGRLYSWRAAAEGIRENPLLGVGLGKGTEEIGRHFDPEKRQFLYMLPVDNYYLSVFLENGIAALALLLSAITVIIIKGVACIRSRGPQMDLTVAALLSIAAILMNAFTFDALLVWPNFMLFWLAAGILYGISRKDLPPAPAKGASLRPACSHNQDQAARNGKKET
ncbi:MAG: O-antigen ligase family protein [Thermoleophilia bacterium]|nr:O-antigen ligase family protein [Thermoleophilia bacterium]